MDYVHMYLDADGRPVLGVSSATKGSPVAGAASTTSPIRSCRCRRDEHLGRDRVGIQS
jgi:hypothetical protein